MWSRVVAVTIECRERLVLGKFRLGGDAARLVFGEHLRLHCSGLVRPAVDIGQGLAVSVAQDVAALHGL